MRDENSADAVFGAVDEDPDKFCVVDEGTDDAVGQFEKLVLLVRFPGSHPITRA